MGFPRKLNICGKVYKVKYFKNVVDVDQDGSEVLWGKCITNKRELRIYEGDDGPDTFDTLIHEMIHAILEEHQMIMAVIGESHEEPLVNDLASAITDCLIRNKLIKEL